MTDLHKLYREMPDERLLKVLAEPHKYHPDALSMARKEAQERALVVPEVVDSSGSGSKEKTEANWFVRTFMNPGYATSLARESDTLDAPAMSSTNDLFNERIHWLVMAAVIILVLVSVYGTISSLVHPVYGVSTLEVLALLASLVIPGVSLWLYARRTRIGYRLIGGLMLMQFLLAILMIGQYLYEYLVYGGYTHGNDLSGLIHMYTATSISSTDVGLSFLYSLLAAGCLWLMWRPEAYRSFGYVRRQARREVLVGLLIFVAIQIVLLLIWMLLSFVF